MTNPTYESLAQALVKEGIGYICPCPDGCNGCEVPDFARHEIERLTAENAVLKSDLEHFEAEHYNRQISGEI